MKLLIFVLVNYMDHLFAIPRCDDSLKTVKNGFRCPTNQFEWKERAKQMKCENVSQNCTEKKYFVYHCLINAWLNQTIEVCAPKRYIAGSYCAEFSIGGAHVQAQYRLKCKACPFSYDSSESFKYQECYNLLRTTEISTKQVNTGGMSSITPVPPNRGENQNITNTNDTENDNGNTVHASGIAGILCGILIALLVPFVYLFIRCRKREKKNFPKLPSNENIAYESKEVMAKELKDVLKYICKLEDSNHGMDGLKEKIRQSPYYGKYVEYLTRNHSPEMSVTGNWREDIGIQAAADIFNIKIFVVQTHKENRITLFLPKDTNAERWIRISVDKECRYSYQSDCDTCNEEEAKLLQYNDVYGIIDKESEDEEDM